MSETSNTSLPQDSVITSYIQRVDYEDCYSFSIPNNKKSIRELYISIFSSASK
jgi:hypothetical protein